MHNQWLVPRLFLLIRKLLTKIFCLSSSWKLGLTSWYIFTLDDLLIGNIPYLFVSVFCQWQSYNRNIKHDKFIVYLKKLFILLWLCNRVKSLLASGVGFLPTVELAKNVLLWIDQSKHWQEIYGRYNKCVFVSCKKNMIILFWSLTDKTKV